MMSRIAVLLLILVLPGRLTPAAAADWLVESRFEEAVARPLIATRDLPAPLKPFLKRLSEERQVAILLDCRIDPSSLIQVNLKAPTFNAGVAELAIQVGASVSVVADTLVVAPRPAAERLRTLIWLKKLEQKEVARISVGREFELVRRRPIHWDDLTEPSQLVAEVAQSYGIQVEGLEQIPYDLWGAGDLAYPNAVEALLILLGEFDLSFEWVGVGGEAIRLVPAPERVTLKKDHVVPRDRRETILQEVAGELPQVLAEMKGTRLQADATLDEHDAIAALIKGVPRQPVDPTAVPLALKRFSLQMDRKPAGSLLKTLQVEGVDVRFDAAQLAQQGVDLRQSVSLKLNKATVQMLLDDLARQIDGFGYRIEGETVYIEVRANPLGGCRSFLS